MLRSHVHVPLPLDLQNTCTCNQTSIVPLSPSPSLDWARVQLPKPSHWIGQESRSRGRDLIVTSIGYRTGLRKVVFSSLMARGTRAVPDLAQPCLSSQDHGCSQVFAAETIAGKQLVGEYMGEKIRTVVADKRVHSTQHTAHSTLHTAHCTLHTAHCTQHTAHCKVRPIS